MTVTCVSPANPPLNRCIALQMPAQTLTPLDLVGRPDKDALLAQFKHKSLESLRTPALLIDRKIFAANAARMHTNAREWGAQLRAHLKTHKTAEGTRLQLVSAQGSTSAIVVSTLMEAWEVVRSGLVSEGIVKDILYGLPVAPNKIDDLALLKKELETHGGTVRLLVDHPAQVRYLESVSSSARWSVFVKIDGGQKRAGLSPLSEDFSALLRILFASRVISLHGFYGHAGDSYGSTSHKEASDFLSGEVRSVNDAAAIAMTLLPEASFPDAHSQPFVLSVGSTPTANAAGAETRERLTRDLHGVLELHAGNYVMQDLQQRSTSLIKGPQISQRVLATVVSYYPGRGKDGLDEALIDAGAIAFSKDSGPSGGYGDVIGHNWTLGRISQEHGILTQLPGEKTSLQVGSQVEIIGQHACLIAAGHPWYYIVDSDVKDGKEVVDVWVPWKGW